MATALTNKALVVLTLLREEPVELTCKKIAEIIQSRTPCGRCDGTGREIDKDGDNVVCKGCYGHRHAFFTYSTAYIALKQLMARGLVSRRHVIDEWGDTTPILVWQAVGGQADSSDPLEELFNAPSADRG